MDEQPNAVRNNFSSLSTATQIGVGALAITLVSTFLPWAKIFVFSFRGTDGWIGISIAVVSVIAIALLALDIPQLKNTKLQSNLAIGSVLLTAALYSYCAIRLANVIDVGGEGDIFSGAVSIGIGMYLGFIGSLTAAGLLIEERWNFLKTENLQVKIGGIAGIISVIALAVPQWGVLSIVGAVIVLAVAAKSREVSPKQLLLSFVVIGMISATGGIVRVATTGSQSGSSSIDLFGDTSKAPNCEELMAEGAEVATIESTDRCKDEAGDLTFLITISETCKNGKTLVYNDSGWGYRSEKWTKLGDAPTGRCNSTATEQCTSIFAAGTITQESWTTMDECLDGEEVKWIYTSSMPCFMDDREYIYNDYGWGFVGTPWTLGKDTPSC